MLAVTSILGIGLGSVTPSPAQAAPALRFKVDEHGSFAIFGNSSGFNCATGGAKVPDPVVGTVDRSKCGSSNEDHGADAL